MLQQGLQHVSQLTVTDAVTAVAMGSGDMPVLATPAMMALMENAAMLAVADHLPEGSTTVGGHISASHIKPTKLGDTVTATAEFEGEEPFEVTFSYDEDNYLVWTVDGESTVLEYYYDDAEG